MKPMTEKGTQGKEAVKQGGTFVLRHTGVWESLRWLAVWRPGKEEGLKMQIQSHRHTGNS